MFLRMSLFRVLIMATSLTEDRLSELRETFSMFDKDMNGSISTEELSQVRLHFSYVENISGPGVESNGSKADKDGCEGHDWGGRRGWERDN